MKSHRSKVTNEEKKRMRVTSATQPVMHIPITIHKTRFEDYRNEGRQTNIIACVVVGLAVVFIGLAKLGYLPTWLVQSTMPRIYS